VYLLLRIFQNFSPIRITTFAAFAVLQGVRGSILQLNSLRLSTVAKSAIADFRFYDKLDKSCHEGPPASPKAKPMAGRHKEYENGLVL